MIQFEYVHLATFTNSVTIVTSRFSATEYERIMATLALGAIRARRSNSSWVNSRSSPLMLSFLPSYDDGTFITKLMGDARSSDITSIRNTERAEPAGIWSMTVPFLIAVTRRISPVDIRQHLQVLQHPIICT